MPPFAPQHQETLAGGYAENTSIAAQRDMSRVQCGGRRKNHVRICHQMRSAGPGAIWCLLRQHHPLRGTRPGPAAEAFAYMAPMAQMSAGGGVWSHMSKCLHMRLPAKIGLRWYLRQYLPLRVILTKARALGI